LPHKAPATIGKDDATLKVCSESGPCGLMIYRFLKRPGIDCLVISPSSLPCRHNDRVKTEHRDAQLARLLRAGELTAVWLPGARGNRLSGAGTPAGQAGTCLGEEHVEQRPAAARQSISGEDPIGPNAPAFSDRRFAFAHRQFLHEEDKPRIRQPEERCVRLGQILEETVSDWLLAPAVTPLQALWRIKRTVVVTFVAEICTGSTVTSN
jgi:hypothetical protein